jgi:hypothetical protein
MSAFIGYGEIGVWTTNAERDEFLDWFAANRCEVHDTRWQYCKCPGNRFMGCDLELNDIIPKGRLFEVSEQELADAAHLAGLLRVIGQIARDEWHYNASSPQATGWPARSLEEVEGVWEEPESGSALLLRCHEARKKPIGLLSDLEFATLLDQGIGVECIFQEAVRRLAANQPDGTEDFDGQLRKAVERIDQTNRVLWHCTKCGHTNWGDVSSCERCQAPKPPPRQNL